VTDLAAQEDKDSIQTHPPSVVSSATQLSAVSSSCATAQVISHASSAELRTHQLLTAEQLSLFVFAQEVDDVAEQTSEESQTHPPWVVSSALHSSAVVFLVQAVSQMSLTES
jgi:hypothetical protein